MLAFQAGDLIFGGKKETGHAISYSSGRFSKYNCFQIQLESFKEYERSKSDFFQILCETFFPMKIEHFQNEIISNRTN